MLSITPDQMASAGGYISREWGDYGYRIEEIESPTRAVTVFHVVASDGSRFTVLADKWGNCRHVDTHEFGGYQRAERSAFLVSAVAAMHANAVAA